MDHGAHECTNLAVWSTNCNLADLGLELGQELFGARRGQVETGRRRAFLTLVFKRAANGMVYSAGNVGRGMDEVEILAACFTD